MRYNHLSLLRHAVVGLVFASFASIAQSPIDVRVALVIGNAAYKHVPALTNPGNDAKSMAFALSRLGFKVVQVVDGDKAAMAQAIEQMQSQLKGQQAVAMLYYAGHGLQLDWRNYMVPVDAQLSKAEEVPKQTVDVEQVIRTFKGAGTRMNIIVLDACRDNPFSSTTGSKGLAQVDAPPGTYLAFATAPGNVAEDGDEASGNGLFTRFLLKELQRPASIESVFKRVRLQVRQKSQGRQVPWDSSSLEDEFAFNDGKKFTFSAEDYQREIQAAKEKEERLKREAEAAAAREKQLAQQREQERLKLAEAQKIQEEQARLKAEAEARERERKLEEAAEEERKKALAAQQALERARQEEAQRLKDIELAKAQVEEETRRKKMSADAALERQFAEEKAEWDKIKDSKNAQDFYAFLLKYPTGVISELATFALERLEKVKITPQADRNGVVQQVGEPRLRAGDQWSTVVRDSLTGVVLRRGTAKVDRVDGGLVYYSTLRSKGIRTVDGAVVQSSDPDGSHLYDPPRPVMPGGEMKVGQRWTVTTRQTYERTGRRATRTETFRIAAYEKISVPAGTFWAYKIDSTAWIVRDDKSLYARQERWYTSDWAIPLKSVFTLHKGKDVIKAETSEVESRTRVP